MDKTIYDIEIRGHYVFQVAAGNAEEAKKLGLAAYRKNTGFVNDVDFVDVDNVITSVNMSSKKAIQTI